LIAASLSEIKSELKRRSPEQVLEFCLRLARHKKENKELLNYLVYEASNEVEYREQVKAEIKEGFDAISTNTLYLAKKSIRKILRGVNKHIRFSGNKQTEAELLISFCEALIQSGIPFKDSPVLFNLFKRQVEKARKAIGTLHEDLQFDYEELIIKLLHYQ